MNSLTYSVQETDGGYIAICDRNKKISVFSRTEGKLDDGINRAARMYAEAYPNDEHAVLLTDEKMRLKRKR